MKMRILALLVITIMLMTLMPQMALAAETHTVANGETLNIETGVLTHADSSTETLTISDGDTISVAAGATATIAGSKNVMIDCGAGTALTLDGVTIDVSATENTYALSFTGTGNTLTLNGASNLKSGNNEPGIRVEGTTELEITGSGSLTTNGGQYAAGIGGGNNANGGHITISGGNITAKGGRESAGIGGGYSGDGGNITISGGSVDATGGGGSGGGAGIGGGNGEYGNTITIKDNAQVTATGGFDAAGIGGGSGGGGGTISISGGTVYARRGTENADDIGDGRDTHSGDLEISGTATVFLRNDSHCALTTSHSRLEVTNDSIIDDKFYGVLMQGTWYSPCWAYTLLYTLNYDRNSVGSTSPPSSVTQAISTKTSVADKGGMIYSGYGFIGWNTAANGSGTQYAPGDAFTFEGNITLYAQWETAYTLDYDKNEGVGTAPPSVVDQLTGTTITVESGDGLTREGYVLDGWNTAKDGSGAPFASGDTLTLTANTTLYAQWETAYTLSYDANGGNGSIPPSTQAVGSKITVESGDVLEREYYSFEGWNTVKEGSGKDYAPGDEFTFEADTTLYAQWTAHPEITSSVPGGKIFVGGRIVLTPNIDGGTWEWEEDYLSATFNSPATFKGLKVGTSTVTYMVDGVSATYDVTIEESELPQTGQNFMLVWVLAGLAAVAVIVAAFLSRSRKVKFKE